MRLLVIHNRYRSALPSGENLVVDDEIAAMRSRGHEVLTYIRESDEIQSWSRAEKALKVTSPITSRVAARDVADLIRRNRPDVVHVHNVYPLISPAVIRVAHEAGVPVVQTVHNHRHVCVKGTYFRDGQLCRECLGHRFPIPAVRHRCYRDSVAQSALMATSLAVNRPTFGLVTRFIALTAEIADHLRSFGVRNEHIVVKPNSVEDPGAGLLDGGTGFVYVGRLSEEKGVQLLCDAWRTLPRDHSQSLTIVGDGPLSPLVKELSAETGNVRFMGAASHQNAIQALKDSAIVIIPSTCPDVFPRVAVEALGCGRPIVASRLGGLPTIIDQNSGWLCAPSLGSLRTTLIAAMRERNNDHARAARRRYERYYTPQVVHSQLESIYREVSG